MTGDQPVKPLLRIVQLVVQVRAKGDGLRCGILGQMAGVVCRSRHTDVSSRKYKPRHVWPARVSQANVATGRVRASVRSGRRRVLSRHLVGAVVSTEERRKKKGKEVVVIPM